MRPICLRVSHLDFSFASTQIIHDISFEVHSGETLGILGPNGSGKTTLLSLLSGLYPPPSHAIQYFGFEKFHPGVIFHSPSLDEKLTAYHNLKLTAILYRIPSPHERISKLLQKVNLFDRQHDAVHTFSGGMKRRLDIARAFLHTPKLLLLDEPTQGLDETSFREFWKYMTELKHTENATLILSTHRPEEAAFCDRVMILNHGALQTIDTPQHLLKQLSQDVIVRQATLGDLFFKITGEVL